MFPGDDFGAPTRQIARYVVDNVFPRADFYLDLHAGGRTRLIQPSAHVVLSDTMDPALARANSRMAEVFGIGIAQAALAPVCRNKLARQTDHGVYIGRVVVQVHGKAKNAIPPGRTDTVVREVPMEGVQPLKLVSRWWWDE